MTIAKTIGLPVTVFCIITLLVTVASAANTPGNQQYTLEQTLSDQAQQSTIAFDCLAFLTGEACSDTFLPPGKVADYAGFQYLRDNDPTQMGHNTDFVTRASDNVLSILNDDQLAEFVTLSKTEAPLTSEYGYMRFPLMKAFRCLLEGTIPAGSSGLDKAAVMAYSAQLYDVDASISIERAKTYAKVIRSLNQTQRAYLDMMASGGMLSWPVVDASEVLKNCGQGNSVAMRTFASEMFAWYAGNVTSDVYFCPERQATYFGSFYMKDRPAMGNPNYSINTTLTGDSGQAFLALLTDSQRENITCIVDIQRADLNEIVAERTAIATELRQALSGEIMNETAVRAFSARYGELDGEISYYYATHFAEVAKTTTSEQKQKMIALRNLSGFVCEGAYLYSQSISMPQDIPSDFLFGIDPTSEDTIPPSRVTGLQNTTYAATYITWTWTDPSDSDFDRVMIYLNDIFQIDVTKGVQVHNATGLSPNTQYVISTRTIDTSGNVNTTWRNQTAWTAREGVTCPTDKIGIFRDGFWILEKSGNFQWDGAPDDIVAGFGMAGDIPVVSDWNNDNKDNIGVFRDGFWILDRNGNFLWDGPPGDIVAGFGTSGDVPVAQDWNNDGSPEIAVFRASAGQWIIDNNRNFLWDGTGPGQDVVAILGQTGDEAAVGDWDATGSDKMGIFRDGFWILDKNGNFLWDGPPDDIIAGFGMAGDIPVVADWNDNNQDNIGLFRDGFWILDYNGNYQWDDVGTGNDLVAAFGMPGDIPVAKDWNGDWSPEIAVYRGSTGQWIIDYNRNFLWDGPGPGLDVVTYLGKSGDKAAAGIW